MSSFSSIIFLSIVHFYFFIKGHLGSYLTEPCSSLASLLFASGVHILACLLSASGVHILACLLSASGVHILACLLSASGVHSLACLLSASGVHSLACLLSASGVHILACLSASAVVHILACLLGDSGGVVNSLDFCPASLRSLGCFYFRCVLFFTMEVGDSEFANFTQL